MDVGIDFAEFDQSDGLRVAILLLVQSKHQYLTTTVNVALLGILAEFYDVFVKLERFVHVEIWLRIDFVIIREFIVLLLSSHVFLAEGVEQMLELVFDRVGVDVGHEAGDAVHVLDVVLIGQVGTDEV